MQRLKRARLALFLCFGAVPFLPVPLAVQVGLTVLVLGLMVALARIARNPGTPEADPAPRLPSDRSGG